MKIQDHREAAAILERLGQAVAAGEITAGPGFVGRIEGAAEALKALGRTHRERAARRV